MIIKLTNSIFVCLLTVVVAHAQVEYVNPKIGGVAILLAPTTPTVSLPNSMVRVYPIRKDLLDDQIQSFPLSIISHRIGELFSIMPGASGRPAAYDFETTTPYYYSTRFPDSMIRTEFTPTERCGYFRFTFPTNEAGVVLANRLPGNWVAHDDGTVSGEENFNDMKAYVYGVFDAPVTVKTTSLGEKTRLTVSAGKNILEFRYGVSFISVAQAKANLAREIPAWGFEKIKTQAKQIWNQRLGQIQVSGGTDAQRRVFYTALYRCSERMVNINEYGRYYSAYDHQVHEDARPFYVDCWIWDLFRAEEPLQTLLDPQREADKIQSYVRMYQQSGWMPTFALVTGEHPCMNGNHAAIWFADAWFKGVRDFDVRAAYDGVKKNSLEGTKLPWRFGPKCSLDDFYNTNGYMPALKSGEKETEPLVHDFEKRQPVAVTLENSYDDWAIAQLAGQAGKPEDRDLFLKRGQFYKNVFRVDKGLAWPKAADGTWIEPLNPKLDGGPGYRNYYDENNGYTYTWDAPQDYDGLFTLMGGRQKALANLDQLFRESLGTKKNLFYVDGGNSTGMVGQFSMGNEPSLPIPYLYNRLGAPWKTQHRVRTLLDAFFTDTYEGMPGDEDGSGMSAWVVFSMMGFYPVTPGLPVYDIASPVFDKTVITLPNGKTFTILAKDASPENQYVQRIRLNGKPLDQVWFRHADIVNGGTLELQMGRDPNRTLGALPESFPPCSATVDPQSLISGITHGDDIPRDFLPQRHINSSGSSTLSVVNTKPKPETAAELMLVTASVNGKPGQFLFDTGACITVLDSRFAKAVGLTLQSPNKDESRIQVAGMKIAQINALQLGDQVFEKFSVGVNDQSDMSQSLGNHLDGVIGMNVLRFCAFQIDFRNQQILLNPPRPAVPSVPIFYYDGFSCGQIFVDAQIAGQTCRMAVDTGYDFASLKSKEWSRMPQSAVNQQTMQFKSVAFGSTNMVIRTMLGECQVGEAIPKKIFVIEEHNQDVLGMDFLKDYLVTLDYKAGEAYVQNYPAH